MTDKLSLALDGATRVHYIVGDPIAQVKSPAGVSLALQARGQHALVVPAHVAPADLAEGCVSLARNVDGLIVTVPHKFACFDLCASHSDRAAFLHTVNVMRRRPDGGWHGDMFDGQGFVAAMQRGGQPAGRKALLVVRAAPARRSRTRCCWPVSELAIHDEDAQRRQTLLTRLAGLGLGTVRAGSADPSGFDLVLNATPVGMRR
jgi:shikimate dehydrogenase